MIFKVINQFVCRKYCASAGYAARLRLSIHIAADQL
jgi:hypothetical protein